MLSPFGGAILRHAKPGHRFLLQHLRDPTVPVAGYVCAMARINMDGKPIRRVLEWLLNRDLTDADMAAALDVHPSNYSRHKDDDDYPSFEELATLGEHFHVSPRMLQIAFGLLDTDALILLDEDEMKQYLEQGGGNHMDPTGSGGKEVRKSRRLSARADRPPL